MTVPGDGGLPAELTRFDPDDWGGGLHSACRWWDAKRLWDARNPESRFTLDMLAYAPAAPFYPPRAGEPPCGAEHASELL